MMISYFAIYPHFFINLFMLFVFYDDDMMSCRPVCWLMTLQDERFSSPSDYALKGRCWGEWWAGIDGITSTLIQFVVSPETQILIADRSSMRGRW